MADDPLREGSYLARWFRELDQGKRTVNDYDTLWRAACWEAYAWDYPAGSSQWRRGIDRARDLMLIAEGRKSA